MRAMRWWLQLVLSGSACGALGQSITLLEHSPFGEGAPIASVHAGATEPVEGPSLAVELLAVYELAGERHFLLEHEGRERAWYGQSALPEGWRFIAYEAKLGSLRVREGGRLVELRLRDLAPWSMRALEVASPGVSDARGFESARRRAVTSTAHQDFRRREVARYVDADAGEVRVIGPATRLPVPQLQIVPERAERVFTPAPARAASPELEPEGPVKEPAAVPREGIAEELRDLLPGGRPPRLRPLAEAPEM